MREIFSVLGGLVGVSVLLHYAINVVRGKAEAGSVASWLMWTAIDSLLFVTTWQAGKPAWLPLGWTIGAGLVTISLLRQGQWSWSGKETLSAVCAATAAVIWQTQGAVAGVFAGTAALTFAGLPILLDMIQKPIREMFYVCGITSIACVLTLLGSDGSPAGVITPCGSLIYNAVMCYLARR